jgi:soluble lytic murein transglycosylase-like protein
MAATWTKLKLVIQTLVGDVREGFVEITRHSLAVIGLAVVATALTFSAQPSLQQVASSSLLNWLEDRQIQFMPAKDSLGSSSPAERSTATPVHQLNPEQLTVTHWLSRRYKISPEPLAALVSEAWSLGERSQIAPTLILSIMAIESRFNPFASDSQGRLGLMKIEPDALSTALIPFGGRLAAFDPLTNLRVGTRHLQVLIQDSHSLEDALRLYAIASGQGWSERYVERVLAEQKLLDQISRGQENALDDKALTTLTRSPLAQM